ncbi:MAG TPA: response regulator [Bryobacteraceae bacterium]|nr:response regulator [Bryobacteraceae bacterium]
MNKRRILLVEDEKVVAADIQECVKGLGYEVVGAAATGIEALHIAVRTEPDLVLMDIKLKGDIDGIDVAGALYDQLKIPVVYLTAHADAEILERAKLTAPSGYVLKPFDERTLRTAIEIAFDRHRRERQLIESGQRLAAAIGSIDEAVIVTQENGHVALMNRVAEILTGWRQEEALGRPLDEVFATLDGQIGSPRPSPIGRVLREGIAIGLGGHAILLGRRGERVPIQGSATPVRDGDAQTVGVCLLFRATGQRSSDEPWGAPDHSSVTRMEILGRLTAAVAQKFTGLLEGNRGRTRATRLANRLLEFGRRQPSPPANLDLNELITDLEDLLQCALGDIINLRTVLAPDAGAVKIDPGYLELLLMHLASSAREYACPGEFSIETAAVTSEDAGDRYAIITVTMPADMQDASGLPALDEIVRESTGEIRVANEDGAIKVYIPSAAAAVSGE